jgi:hypothetical protein
MSQKGRPPKPNEQKRKLGNPGKRPLPDAGEVELLPAAETIPEPPRPLLEPGRTLWDRTWKSGINWISPVSDIELLLMTCEMLDERWNLRIKVMQSDNMQMARRLDNLSRIIAANLSQLGFTPADRARLGLAEVARQSRLAELKQMKRELVESSNNDQQ